MRRSLFVFAMPLFLASIAHAQEKAAEPNPPPRESLRYDGKPFEYWQTYWQTELKAERRVECLRAMGAFGSNGYGAEAAAAIVALVRTYPDKGFLGYPNYSEKLTPDEKVFFEIYTSLEKIGSPAAHALLAHANHPNVRLILQELFGVDGVVAVPTDAIPTLVKMVVADQEKERDLALLVLYCHVSQDEKLIEPLVRTFAKSNTEPKFIVAALRGSPIFAAERLLGALAPRSSNLLPILTAQLRELKKARQMDVEEEKAKFSKRKQPPGDSSETWEDHLARFCPRSLNSSCLIARVLGEMGPAARSALPELREALEDPCTELQNAARTAIAQITKKQR